MRFTSVLGCSANMLVQTSKFIKRNPWIVFHAGCMIAFTVQMTMITIDLLYPSQTVTTTSRRNMSDMEFPVLFKICIDPSYYYKDLEEVGYANYWDYFLGRSKYNSSIFGWAGHTKDGGVFSNVTGDLVIQIIYNKQAKVLQCSTQLRFY